MVTIKDIAREAGVSHGTVSNVLNRTNKVSIEKIRAVEAAVRKLGYIPNTEARKLRKGVAEKVVLILPTLESDCYRDFYSIFRELTEASGRYVSLYITHDIEGEEESIISRMIDSNLSGVVSVTCLGDKAGALYSQFTCPVIFVDRKITDSSGRYGFVGFDLDEAGREIGQMIIDRGFSSVAFFSSPSRFRDDSRLFNALSRVLSGKCGLVRFTSDISLAIPKAFSIVRDMPSVDAVIATSLARAEAFSTVIRLSRMEKEPKIIAVSSSHKFPNPHFASYELDYNASGRKAAETFMKSLKLGAIATHVADARTCCLHPASTTHRQMNDEELLAAGVSADLVRLSVGLESKEDLIADLSQALEQV